MVYNSNIIAEYPTLAARSAARLYPDAALIDGALGLCGEVGELLDIIANGGSTHRRRDELGDCYWYVATRWLPALDLLGLTFFSPVFDPDVPKPRVSDTEAACNLVVAASTLAELVKKAHAKAPDAVAATLMVGGKSIVKHLAAVIYWLGFLATDVGGIEVVLAANIAKLEARHPDGFNADYVKEQTS